MINKIYILFLYVHCNYKCANKVELNCITCNYRLCVVPWFIHDQPCDNPHFYLAWSEINHVCIMIHSAPLVFWNLTFIWSVWHCQIAKGQQWNRTFRNWLFIFWLWVSLKFAFDFTFYPRILSSCSLQIKKSMYICTALNWRFQSCNRDCFMRWT